MFGRIFGAEKLKEIFQFYFIKARDSSVSHVSKDLGGKGGGHTILSESMERDRVKLLFNTLSTTVYGHLLTFSFGF